MTEPCMFPNLHEPFYCRIHADVRLRLTDERCRRGVTLTQPQPDPRTKRLVSLALSMLNTVTCPKCNLPRVDGIVCPCGYDGADE